MDASDIRFSLELLNRVEEVLVRSGRSPEDPALTHFSHALSTAKSSLLQIMGAVSFPASPSQDPMKTALRVLTAYAERSIPEPADLDVLVRVCGRRPAGMAWDEFACEVLQKVLRDRAVARDTMAVGASAAAR